jgi:hypothetical protein
MLVGGNALISINPSWSISLFAEAQGTTHLAYADGPFPFEESLR